MNDFADKYYRIRRGDRTIKPTPMMEWIAQMYRARQDGILPAEGGLGAQNPRLLEMFDRLSAKDAMVREAENGT